MQRYDIETRVTINHTKYELTDDHGLVCAAIESCNWKGARFAVPRELAVATLTALVPGAEVTVREPEDDR